MSNKTKPKGVRGRPVSGRRSYTVRMKPATQARLASAWGQIGAHLDRIAESMGDMFE